jgi:hypothetical protein
VVLEIRSWSTFDQRFVRNRFDGDSLFEEPVEKFATAARFAAVESEREVVEVSIQMLQAY